MGFQGSRFVFHGSKWVFTVFQGSRLVFRGSRWVLRVNHGSRLVFIVYRSVFIVTGWFSMVPGGFSCFLAVQDSSIGDLVTHSLTH